MDLQVYLIIVTVFFVSLGSLLFINRQLGGGKTFEQAWAEKRHLNEKLYGNSKKKNASKKSNTNKKVYISKYIVICQFILFKFGVQINKCNYSLPQHCNQNRGGKNAQEAKQQQQKHSAVESETKSDSGSENEENASSASTASNENAPKIHVEFTEAEIIAPETNVVYKVGCHNKPPPQKKKPIAK